MKNLKTFEEHSMSDDYLDTSYFTAKNVDILDIGPGYRFYRANDVREAQEILKVWPDIKLPLKHTNLLELYFKQGRVFLFFVTKNKNVFFFADVYAGRLGAIHNEKYETIFIEDVPEPAKSLFLEYKNLS